MKPLLLSLEGLQSYRERQEIDFHQMEGCGLFGIFGPTGSGKSTVLDAMTLALYGAVSRASNKTQGIINSTCDLLTVSFTFALQIGQVEQKYRVERIYRRRRQQPDSSEARVGRLIRLDDAGDTVLADKPSDVTQAVEDLIGLKFTDFVRAVVLPQNQFQDFLLLGKKEKSDMLERLFCLEEYGSSLNRKIVASRRTCDEQMQQARGALEALADSADDRVASLRAAAGLAALERQKVTGEHDRLRRLQDELAGRYQWTRDREQLLVMQSALSAREPEMEKARFRLQQAQRAEPIWPLWQSLDKLRRQDRELTEELARLEPELAAARQTRATHADKLQTILATSDQVREHFRDEQARFERAAALAGRLQQNLTDLARSNRQAEDLKTQISKLALREAQTQEDIRAADIQLEALRSQRRAARVDPAWRQAVDQWVRLLQQIRTNGEERQVVLVEVAQTAVLVEGRRADFLHMASLATREDVRLFQEAASHLEPGKPCPVCGSTEHPHVAAPEDADSLALPSAADRQACQRALIQAEEQLKNLDLRLTALDDAAARLDSAVQTQTDLQPELRTLDEPDVCLQDLHERERLMQALDQTISELEVKMPAIMRARQLALDALTEKNQLYAREQAQQELLTQTASGIDQEMQQVMPDLPNQDRTRAAMLAAAEKVKSERAAFDQRLARMQTDDGKLAEQLGLLEQKQVSLLGRRGQNEDHLHHVGQQFTAAMTQAGLADEAELGEIRLEPAELKALAALLQVFDNDQRDVHLKLKHLDERLQGAFVDEAAWTAASAAAEAAGERLDQAVSEDDTLRTRLLDLEERRSRRLLVQAEFDEACARRDRIGQIEALVRGNAFVEYVAEERLRAIAAEASGFLQTLSRGRFALELDGESAFVVRDQMNGGQVRAASTLSGGETFMTSLALALALSAQIQIRGQSRLAFFFLDEGFGSLDHELLDQVMDALERVGSPERLIGLISHVQELQQRLPVRLVISPADGRRGSRISLQRS